MNDTIKDTQNAIHDLMTSVDPYSNGKDAGDSFLRDLLDLVGHASQLHNQSAQAVTDSMKAYYGYA